MKLKRQINEKDLLKMLGIPSFRHMSKDKLVSFVSALPDIDPEVAKKALEQFPDFASTMAEITAHYKDVIAKCLEGSDADTAICLEACEAINESIRHELDKDDLSFEERERLIDKQIRVVQMMREIDADGKRFRINIARIATVAFGVAAALLVTGLGGKTNITLPEIRRAA